MSLFLFKLQIWYYSKIHNPINNWMTDLKWKWETRNIKCKHCMDAGYYNAGDYGTAYRKICHCDGAKTKIKKQFLSRKNK